MKSVNIINKATKITKDFQSVEELSDYLLNLNKAHKVEVPYFHQRAEKFYNALLY